MTDNGVWGRFRRSALALAALLYVGALTIIAAAAPLIAGEGRAIPFDPNAPDIAARLAPPDSDHLLGTDELGRDVFSRLIHGTRVSLGVGIGAAAMSLLIGTIAGAFAGYFGGPIDWTISRAIEVILCFPFLFLVLGIVAILGPSIWTIVIALAITSWTNEARFTRAEVMRLREMEFAEAARAAGAGSVRVVLRHLLPNALAPSIVSAGFGIATAILTESALSFLGLGVQVPMPSWGAMLGIAQRHMGYAWWLAVYPGLAIFATVAAFNLIADRFRDSLDPQR